jgi:hypothetical protein
LKTGYALREISTEGEARLEKVGKDEDGEFIPSAGNWSGLLHVRWQRFFRSLCSFWQRLGFLYSGSERSGPAID